MEENNLKNELISAIMELTHEERVKLLQILKEPHHLEKVGASENAK